MDKSTIKYAAKSVLEKIVAPEKRNVVWSAITHFIIEKKFTKEIKDL